ncbi:MAG: hypothetical protein AAGE52_27525 [Myxococcota bacterium]
MEAAADVQPKKFDPKKFTKLPALTLETPISLGGSKAPAKKTAKKTTKKKRLAKKR